MTEREKFDFDGAYTKEEFVAIARGLLVGCDDTVAAGILLDLIQWAEGSTSDVLIRFDVKEDGTIYPYRNFGTMEINHETGEVRNPDDFDLSGLDKPTES